MSYYENYDSGLDIVSGKVTGKKVISIYGRNPDIDIADGFETVWNGGGIYTGTNATAAEKVEIFSSSAEDGAGTLTGALTIKVSGLDENWDEQEETVTLNGTGVVETVGTYIRMSYAETLTAGSTGSNVGTITARQTTTTSNVFFNMPATYNHTAVGSYSIPAGYTGYLRHWHASIISKASSASEVRFLAKEFGVVWRVEDVTAARSTLYPNIDHPNYFRHMFPEKTDIRIDADTDTNNTVIGCGFCIVLVA